MLIFAKMGSGQGTYSSADFVSVGDEVIYSQAINPELSDQYSTSGANAKWDFSNMASVDIDTITYLDPNSTGYRFYYCFTNAYIFNCQAKFDDLTNIAEVGIDSFQLGAFRAQNLTRHFKLTSEEFSETMLGITADIEGIDVPVAIDFDKKDVILHFPLTYGAIDSSESVFDLDLTSLGFQGRFKRVRKRTTKVEAYGELTTPAGTYEDVLKVKSLIYNSDTTFLDTLSLPISSIEVEYRWFAKGEKGPVLQASGLLLAGNEVISNVRYQGVAQSSSVEHGTSLSSNLSVFPNPVVNILQVEAGGEEVTRILIFDAMGKKVYEDNTSSMGKTVDMQPMPSGNYFMQVSTKSGSVNTWKITKISH